MADLNDVVKLLEKLFDQGKKKNDDKNKEINSVNSPNNKITYELEKFSRAFENLGFGSRSGNKVGGSVGNELVKTGGQLSGGFKPFAGVKFDPKSGQWIPPTPGGPIGTGPIPGSPAGVGPTAGAPAWEAGAAEATGAAEAGTGVAGMLEGLGAGLAEIAAPIAAIAGPIAIIVGGVTLIAGVIYKVVEGLVKLGVYLVEMPFRVKEWANSLLKSQEYLKQFSGAMAAVFNRKEIFETYQNMRIGAATAGSAGNLEKAYEGLSEALEPLNILMANIWNEGVTVIVQIMTVLVDIVKFALQDILTVLNLIAQLMSTLNAVNQALFDWWKGKDKKDNTTSPFEGFARNFHKQVAAGGIR